MLVYLFTADLTSALIVAVHPAADPAVHGAGRLVHATGNPRQVGEPVAAGRAFHRRRRRPADPEGVRPGEGPGGSGPGGDRRLSQGVDGHPAGGVPVVDGAGTAGLAVGRAGRRRDRAAAGLRRPHPRDRARSTDSRAGGVPAAAPARHPVPRRGGRGCGHRQGAGHPRHTPPGARHADRPAGRARVPGGGGDRRGRRASAALSGR